MSSQLSDRASSRGRSTGGHDLSREATGARELIATGLYIGPSVVARATQVGGTEATRTPINCCLGQESRRLLAANRNGSCPRKRQASQETRKDCCMNRRDPIRFARRSVGGEHWSCPYFPTGRPGPLRQCSVLLSLARHRASYASTRRTCRRRA